MLARDSPTGTVARGVFEVIFKELDPGEVVKIIEQLPVPLRGLWRRSRAAARIISASNRRADRSGSSRIYAALTVIFFSAFWASAVLGNLTVSTPLAKFASILSASTPSGNWNERWKEP